MSDLEKNLKEKYSYHVAVDLITRLEEYMGYNNIIASLDQSLCDYVELGKNLNPLIARINKLLALWEKKWS